MEEPTLYESVEDAIAALTPDDDEGRGRGWYDYYAVAQGSAGYVIFSLGHYRTELHQLIRHERFVPGKVASIREQGYEPCVMGNHHMGWSDISDWSYQP